MSPPPVRHRWGMLAGFLALAVAVSAGAYFFLSEKYAADPIIPTYTPRESVDPTANWKTYTNSKLRFELKYPSNYIFGNMDNSLGLDSLGIYFAEQGKTYSSEVYGSILGPITLRVQADRYNGDIQKLITNPQVRTLIKPATIGGKAGYSIIGTTPPAYHDQRIVFANGYVYIFNSSAQLVQEPNITTIFEQMLSTFKFTDMTDTSTWKTYTNTEYGIELKYPNEFQSITPTDRLIPSGSGGINLLYVGQADVPKARMSVAIYPAGTFTIPFINSRFQPAGPTEPSSVSIGGNQFYFYGPGGGGANYPDQYFFNANGRLVTIIFSEEGQQGKSPSETTRQLEQQILSTFKFTK